MRTFQGEPAVGGAFLWTLDYIVRYDADNQKLKDPGDCADAASMPAYVAAISGGFGGNG